MKYKKQEKVELTEDMVRNAEPHSIIHEGECYIEHPWFNQAKSVSEGGNLEKDGRSVKVKYVIFRGGIADWCIYHSLDANLEKSDYLQGTDHLERSSYVDVKRFGGKLHREDVIRSVVECSDEVMKMYRH